MKQPINIRDLIQKIVTLTEAHTIVWFLTKNEKTVVYEWNNIEIIQYFGGESYRLYDKNSQVSLFTQKVRKGILFDLFRAIQKLESYNDYYRRNIALEHLTGTVENAIDTLNTLNTLEKKEGDK